MNRPNQEENWALWQQYNPRTGDWLSDTKDIFLRFLQDFFYQMPAGQQPPLFHFEPLDATKDLGEPENYQTSEVQTEIIITDAGSVNTESIEKRPVIVISRGPFAYGNTSMDRLQSIQTATDRRAYTDLLSGSFVFNCISRQGVEAERLAVIVARAIRYYHDLLQKQGFFAVGAVIQVGVESPPGSLLSGDSTSDYVNVPVSAQVHYQESWVSTPVATALARVQFTAYAILRRMDWDLVYPDALDEDGNPVEGSESVTVAAWTVE